MLRSHLLIASPHLGDPNFSRSVVLMVEHNEQGALGVTFNRPGPKPLREIWAEVVGDPCEYDGPIFLGGPVDGPLMAVHTLAAHAETEVCEGVYFSSQADALRAIVAAADKPFRVFSGYSGWGAGQLEAELEAGGWLTLPATRELLFETPADAFWPAVVKQVGNNILFGALQIPHPPGDPSLN